VLVLVLGVSGLCWTTWLGNAGAEQAPATHDSASSWTVYHGDAAGSGVSTSATKVDTSSDAWTSPALDGQLYGEPLVSGGDIYVATENNTVYALSSSTGSVVWSKHIADPVPASSLPCGDISPTVGITGTPIIDPSRNEIFVVADELVQGTPAHILVGLSTTSGAIELTQNVDPAGATPAALLQRTGLTLDDARVVFAMGGNFGDCSTYRGRVEAVSETGGPPLFFTVDAAAGQRQGAIWMGGAAPAVDHSGNIWVTAGNGSVESTDQPYDDSDAALELSSSLKLLQYFAPTTWAQDNAHDLDLSVEPTLLSTGQVLVSGKSRIIDLLNSTHLGGIGGEQEMLASGCAQSVDGGSAVVGTTVYLPCLAGPIAVRVVASPPSLNLLWSSDVGGGPPIVAAGLVWTIGQNGTLYGLDPSTGKVRQQASIGVPANHFPTASEGDGLLLAPSANRVVAFHATTATPTTAPTTTSSSGPTSTSTTPIPTSRSGGNGGISGGAIAGIVAAGLLLLGGITFLIRTRR